MLACSPGVAIAENKYESEINLNVALESAWVRHEC